MIQLNCFPGGRRRAATFSYDDGLENDARLIELFNKYDVKASFNLNSMRYMDKNDEELRAIGKRYEGHEIACHGYWHADLNRMTPVSIINEVMEDRKVLEKIAGYPVVGFAYGNGRWDDEVVDVLRSCGILYARTTQCTMSGIDLPKELLALPNSCHHKDAMPVAEKFLEELDYVWPRPVLYIFGHSYEFRTEEDWAYMEKLVSMIAGNEKIWYATSREICNYTVAQRRLCISADEKMIFNPSCIPVWVEQNRKEVVKIEPGETVYLK